MNDKVDTRTEVVKCLPDPDDTRFIKHVPGDFFAHRCACGYQWQVSPEEAVLQLETRVCALVAERDKWLAAFNRSEQFQNGPTKRAEDAEARVKELENRLQLAEELLSGEGIYLP